MSVTGNFTNNGQALFQNSADSTAAFRIQNLAGTSNLFVADTTNTRIGIGVAAPLHTLDVRSAANGARGLFVQNSDAGSSASSYVLLATDTGTGGGLAFNSSTNTSRGGVSSLNLVNTMAANLTLGTSNLVQATIGATGATVFKNSTDSTAAFQIQNSSSVALLTADSTNSRISIGTSDTTGTLFVLDIKTDSGDPTGVEGAMYYNDNSNKFRCYQNSGWTDCISAGGSTTLQDAYNNSSSPATILTADAKDILFSMANTTTDANFRINVATSSTSEFQVEANGTDVLQIGSAGQLQLDVQGSGGGILIGGDVSLYRSAANVLRTDDSFIVQPASNNTAAFLVQNNGGTNNVLQVDTTNSRVAIGLGTTAPAQRLTVNAGANYGWNDYIGLTDGTRTAYMGLANSSGTLGFRTGETGDTASDYIFFGSNGTTQIATLDGNDGLRLNIANNDVLVLNNTDPAGAGNQSYVQLSFEDDEALEFGAEIYDGDQVGTDDGRRFYIWSDVDSSYLLQLDHDEGGTIQVNNASEQAFRAQRDNGQEFMDVYSELHGADEYATLALGEGFEGSQILFTANGTTEWALYSDDSSDLGSDSFYLYNSDLGMSALSFNGNGNARFASTDSATAFRVQDQDDHNIFTADTTNNRIIIGQDTGNTLLQLDDATSDPGGVEGGMYYNSSTDTFRCYQASAWQSCGPQTKKLGSDFSRTATSFADVTGMTFSISANTDYLLECDLFYTTAATTTGIDLAINGPASPTSVVGEWRSFGATTTALQSRLFRQYNLSSPIAAVDAANSPIPSYISAIVRNGANSGTLALRSASEASGSAAVVKTGSVCRLTQL